MSSMHEGELQCPQCGHANPAKADYCWECRHDFVHNERLKARPAPPPPPPRKIPPPYSTRQPDGATRPREPITVYELAVEVLVSTLIVGGSWALLSVLNPDMKLGMFVGGWAIALVMVKISEGVLPDPETDHTKYFSWNPFEYKDDVNRKVLSAHISLFLPRIVLRTIRRGFSLVFAR